MSVFEARCLSKMVILQQGPSGAEIVSPLGYCPSRVCFSSLPSVMQSSEDQLHTLLSSTAMVTDCSQLLVPQLARYFSDTYGKEVFAALCRPPPPPHVYIFEPLDVPLISWSALPLADLVHRLHKLTVEVLSDCICGLPTKGCLSINGHLRQKTCNGLAVHIQDRVNFLQCIGSSTPCDQPDKQYILQILLFEYGPTIVDRLGHRVLSLPDQRKIMQHEWKIKLANETRDLAIARRHEWPAPVSKEEDDKFSLVVTAGAVFQDVPDMKTVTTPRLSRAEAVGKARATAKKYTQALGDNEGKKSNGRWWCICDLKDLKRHYSALLNMYDLRGTRVQSPNVWDEHGVHIHVSDYKTKFKEGAIVELEVILKLWTIKPRNNPSNPRDTQGSRVYQIMLQYMQLLPCAKYTQSIFIDSLSAGKGKRRAVDEAVNQSPTNKGSFATTLKDDEPEYTMIE
ncbi:hypothetical protein BDR03DRAFT_980585 [Suillus americanus]|nr:hypothetical protein BDR03DRAFT_980585 [Suillus americanus]